MEFKDKNLAKNTLLELAEYLKNNPASYRTGMISGKQFRRNQCIALMGIVVNYNSDAVGSDENIYHAFGRLLGVGKSNAWFINMHCERLYNKHYPNDGKTWGTVEPEQRQLEYNRRDNAFSISISEFLITMANRGSVEIPFPYAGLKQDGKPLNYKQ